jgi:HEAT repeats
MIPMHDTAHRPTRAAIRAAVLGKSVALERRAAFALLGHSDDPEREELLANIARESGESLQQRAMAAITLGHIRTPKAELLLTQVAESSPSAVLPYVLLSLGRIGSPEALPTVDQYASSTPPTVAATARFAAALIAHRFRLPGHDLSTPAADELLPKPNDTGLLVEVARVSAEDAQGVLNSIGQEGYGIELAGGVLTQLRCGTDVHTICLNRDFVNADGVTSLLQKKALLALVGLASREGAGHSVSYVILSAPSRTGAGIELLAPRCTGRPALAGCAQVTDDEIHFSLRAVDRPGARALALDGSLRLGNVTLRAVAATRRSPAPSPHDVALS